MSWLTERDQLPYDPLLPGLEIVLDNSALHYVLQRLHPRWYITHVVITYIKYKPHTSCLVGFQIDCQTERYAGYVRAVRWADLPTKVDPQRLVVAEYALEIRLFPTDRRVLGLRSLTDERRPLLLQRLLRSQDAQCWHSPLVPLVYKPERRYVAKICVNGLPQAVLKFYTTDGYAAAQQPQLANNGATLRVARVLGRHQRRAVIAYEWLPGTVAHTAIYDSSVTPERFQLIGSALAELHQQAADTRRCRTRQHDINAWHEAADAVAAVCPTLAPRIISLVERIARRSEYQPDMLGLLHGDFYARQVLLQEQHAALIDFDEAVYGDRRSDLANFVAHLEYDVLSGRLPRSRADAVALAVLEGYQRTSSLSVTAAFSLAVAARLLLLAPHPFRNQEVGWSERTRALLDRIDELLTCC